MTQDVQLHRRLRSARRKSHVPLRVIADSLNVDPSYLSHVENGRRAPTKEVIEAYRAHVVDKEGSLSSEYDSGSLVNNIIERARQVELVNLESAPLTKEVQIADKFFSKLMSTALSRQDELRILRTSTDDYHDDQMQIIWPMVLHKVLNSGASLKIFSAPPSNALERWQATFAQDRAQETFVILDEALRYLEYKDRFTNDHVSSLNFGLFPIDIYLLRDRFFDIRFSGGDRRTRGSVFTVEEGASIGHSKPIETYFSRIESYRDFRIQLFDGLRDSQKFIEAYLVSEITSGPRLLSQTFFGAHTRPPENFKQGTNWWNRYAGLKLDVARLAEARSLATRSIRERLKKGSSVRQICSRETLETWASSGERQGFGSELIRIFEDIADRINHIEYIVEMLRTEEQFSIAIVDHDKGAPLGWGQRGGKDTVNWLVQDNKTLIVEGHVRRADGNYQEYQCIVNDHQIAQEFTDHYLSFWNNLDSNTKDRSNTISYLRELIKKVK
jgi:transcriptional regulator with XRE-family HTH domain